MEQREKLIDIMAGSPVTSIVSYESTRDLADHLLANGVVVLPCRCKECEWWKYNGADDALIPQTCYGDDGEHFCSYGERKGGDE